MKIYKCQKCKSPPISFVELWTENEILFKSTETGEPEYEGDLNECSRPYGVEAKCECGNMWRLRGVKSISELRA